MLAFLIFLTVFQRKMTDYELILDSDLYKSDQGIQSCGKGTLDDDTVPIQYTAKLWDAIKDRLDFPATAVTAIHNSAIDGQGNINAGHDQGYHSQGKISRK